MSENPLTNVAHWLESIAHEGAALRLDSRQVQPGDIFVAVPGAHVDGRTFVQAALDKGAVGILYSVDEAVPTLELSTPSLGVPHLERHLGDIAAAFYGQPSQGMLGVAVTGTNGKTTTAFWVRQALEKLGHRPGVIGTVGTFFEGQALDSPELTTPDAISLQRIFSQLKAMGADSFAIEASSVGLEQGRLQGANFKVGIFTNLSRDHLDYHQTMQAYEDAKRLLFSWPTLTDAIINIDDPVGRNFVQESKKHGIRVWATGTQEQTVSLAKSLGADHVIWARNLQPADMGMHFELHVDHQIISTSIPAVGVFNISNALGIVGLAMSMEADIEWTSALLRSLVPPPGRMEMIHRLEGPLGVVDYSHTPDALEKALVSLRPTAQARHGRLIVVFGCGGDRDKGKRPLMGEIACRLADQVVITSDNPRTENEQAILDDIVAGIPQGAPYEVIADRHQAIVRAIELAKAEDVVLVAGKGHETEQITATGAHHFSDAEELRAALKQFKK